MRWRGTLRVALILLVGMGLGMGLHTVAQAQKSPREVRLTFIPKTNKVEYWRNAISGFEQACKEFELRCTVQAPLKPFNSEEQISIMESVISGKRADGILLAPNNSRAIIPAIEQANRAGIPVATVTTGAYGGDVFVHVEASFFLMAKAGAERAIREIGGKGNAVIIEGFPGQTSPEETKAGFLAAIEETKGAVKLLASSPGNYQRPQAMKVMEDFLVRFGDRIDYVLSANDDMALGAMQAIRAAGKAGKIKVMGGIGGQLMGAKAIKGGDMTFTIWPNEGFQAYMAAKYLLDFIAEGKRPPSRYVDVKFAAMGPENVDQYLSLNVWENVSKSHEKIIGLNFNFTQAETSITILEKAKAGTLGKN